MSKLDPVLEQVLDMIHAGKVGNELALAPGQVLELTLTLSLLMTPALDLMVVLQLGCVP
jgi:hypothetical protein